MTTPNIHDLLNELISAAGERERAEHVGNHGDGRIENADERIREARKAIIRRVRGIYDLADLKTGDTFELGGKRYTFCSAVPMLGYSTGRALAIHIAVVESETALVVGPNFRPRGVVFA